jgi:hypothetical protein
VDSGGGVIEARRKGLAGDVDHNPDAGRRVPLDLALVAEHNHVAEPALCPGAGRGVAIGLDQRGASGNKIADPVAERGQAPMLARPADEPPGGYRLDGPGPGPADDQGGHLACWLEHAREHAWCGEGRVDQQCAALLV